MLEAWPVSTVGEQFDVQLGKMLDAAKNLGQPKPYLGNRAVQWGKIDVSAVGIVPMTSSDLHRYRLQEGDLLVCEGGEVGRCAIWRDELPECYYQKALHRLRPRNGYNPKLMLVFLEYWASTGMFTNYVTQTSIAHLPRDQFIQMPLPLPSAEEQTKIAERFDHVDELIASLERMIAKKQAIKQGMMQRLLTGEMRLPGFTAGWERVRLGDVATVSRGASPRPIASPRWFSDSSAVGWVRISDLGKSDGVILNSTTQRLSKEGIARSRFLPAGTLILSIAATVGIPIITGIDTCIHDGFVAIERLRGVNKTYLLFALKSLESELRTAGQTGSQANVNTAIVNNLSIWLPCEAEQAQIGVALKDAELELRILERRLRKAAQVKQGMMQQLLAGRTPLSVTGGAA